MYWFELEKKSMVAEIKAKHPEWTVVTTLCSLNERDEKIEYLCGNEIRFESSGGIWCSTGVGGPTRPHAGGLRGDMFFAALAPELWDYTEWSLMKAIEDGYNYYVQEQKANREKAWYRKHGWLTPEENAQLCCIPEQVPE